MSIVTINGETGSGGQEIGQAVANLLGADYVDREILAEAANRTGSTVEALVEKEEQRLRLGDRLSRFLQRLLEKSAIGGAGDVAFGTGMDILLGKEYADMISEPINRTQELDDRRFIEVTTQVIHHLYQSGNTVIIGRASNIVLKDMPRVLHVGLVAPLSDRIKVLADREQITLENSVKLMEEREKARVEFFRKFFKVRPSDPIYYHIVLNTAILKPDVAASIIVEATKSI